MHPGAWLTSVQDAEPQESGSGLGCLFSCFLEGLVASLALQKCKPTVRMFQKISFNRLDLTGIRGPCVPGATFPRGPMASESTALSVLGRPFSSPSTAPNCPNAGQGRFSGICTKVDKDSSGRQERFTPGLQWLWVNKPLASRAINHPRVETAAPCAAHMPASRALCRLPFPHR